MSSIPPTSDSERREYFRVEDEVQLRYICIDKSSALARQIPPEFSRDLSYSLMRELQQIDQESSALLRSIGEQSRETEMYLRALNKKVDVIAKSLASETESLDYSDQQLISLSEGGMAFRAPRELAHDSHLAIQLTLKPSFMSLVLFGRVINCSLATGAAEDGFCIAVSFVSIQESDRRAIAKHIMQVQLAQRRQQHAN